MGGGGPGGGSGGTRTFQFNMGSGGGGPGGFNPSDANDIFSQFMRGSGLGGGGGDDDDFMNVFGAGGAGGARPKRSARTGFGDIPGGMGARMPRQQTSEVTTVERPLPVSLEDLFKGTSKKMKIKCKLFDANGKRTTTEKVLEVPIKAGLKKGSKIRFKGVGDQEEGGQQDLCFIIEEASYSPDMKCLCPSFRQVANNFRRSHTLSTPATATTSS